MRIAIVSEYCRPWPGGVSEHVHHEASELFARGHDVHVFSGPGQGSSPDGVEMHRLSRAFQFMGNGAASRLSWSTQLLGLSKRFRSAGIEVVHVHAPLDPLLPLAATLASPVPVVGTFHASFLPSWKWHALYGSPVCQRANQKLAARIAVSDNAKASHAHYLQGDFECLANGIDMQRFQPQKDTAAGRTILFVGRPDPRKGLNLLLQALAGLPEDVTLTVVGNVPAERQRSLLANLLPGHRARVNFVGFVEPGELPRYFSRCTVFCSPAISGESQGIVLLEAMASGKAPVVFDIAGYREFVCDGKDALVADSIDSGSLKAALLIQLEDQQLRERLGVQARNSAERFAWPKIVDRIEEVFQEAVAAS